MSSLHIESLYSSSLVGLCVDKYFSMPLLFCCSLLYTVERYSGDIESAVMDIVKMLEGKVAPRWYQMGVSLGTPVADLEGIRLSKKSAKESERMMFQALLQSENKHLPRTWQLLVDSVGHKAGGNNQRLAKSLSKKISGKCHEQYFSSRIHESNLFLTARVTVHCLCVCVSVTTFSVTTRRPSKSDNNRFSASLA